MKTEHSQPIGPQHYTGQGGFFSNAEGFILNDPIMTSVHVDNTTVINMQGAVTQSERCWVFFLLLELMPSTCSYGFTLTTHHSWRFA